MLKEDLKVGAKLFYTYNTFYIAEVLFVNKDGVLLKWGHTKDPVWHDTSVNSIDCWTLILPKKKVYVSLWKIEKSGQIYSVSSPEFSEAKETKGIKLIKKWELEYETE